MNYLRFFRKIFVRGLSQNTTRDDLRDYFGNFGPVEDVSLRFLQTASGTFTGTAVVAFYTPNPTDTVSITPMTCYKLNVR